MASAFQYGCAPTLIPATMTLISPPFWVKVMIRRSARDTQSMFSVPLSIEIGGARGQREPLDAVPTASRRGRARRPPGALSASATVPSALVGSPNNATRVMPFGVAGVGRDTTPTTMPARVVS